MKKILILCFTCLALAGCSSNILGWYVINPTTPSGWINIKFLVSGIGNTILISIVAAFISINLGLIIALPGQSSKKGWRIVNRIYVELIRSIPLLPMLFWVFYGFPIIFISMGINIHMDPFWAVVY